MLLGISSMPTTHFWVRNMSASIIIYYCFYCSSGNGPWKNHGLVLLNTTPKSQDSRAFLLEWCRWYVLCSYVTLKMFRTYRDRVKCQQECSLNENIALLWSPALVAASIRQRAEGALITWKHAARREVNVAVGFIPVSSAVPARQYGP